MITIIIAGDTFKLSCSHSDYPPASYDIWIALRSAGLGNIDMKTGETGVTIDTTNGIFEITVTSAATATYEPGIYRYVIYYYSVTERYQVEEGTVEIKPNIASISNVDDIRSHAKIVLDAIEAVIQKRATLDQMAYSIAGRTLSRMPVADLLVLRDRYKYEYLRELQAERVAAGLKPGGQIKVRL